MASVPLCRVGRHCLVLTDGFLNGARATRSHSASGSATSSPRTLSCTIITIEPNGKGAAIYERMPLIIAAEKSAAWLLVKSRERKRRL